MVKLLRRSVISGVIILGVTLPVTAAAQAPGPVNAFAIRVAYFSPERAFASSVDGRAAETRLAALRDERSREISARNARLKGLQDALQQAGPVLADSARRQREQEVERLQLDVQRFIEGAQAEFLGVQRDLENAFLAKLRPALDVVAKGKGLLLVLNADATALAWADPALDITVDVVTQVDRP